MTPQVVTQTLYALAIQSTPAFVPTEIRIITTLEGAERARLTLLDPATGQFHAFCQEYGLTGRSTSTAAVHSGDVGPAGPLSDIRTPGRERARGRCHHGVRAAVVCRPAGGGARLDHQQSQVNGLLPWATRFRSVGQAAGCRTFWSARPSRPIASSTTRPQSRACCSIRAASRCRLRTPRSSWPTSPSCVCAKACPTGCSPATSRSATRCRRRPASCSGRASISTSPAVR